MAKQEVARVVLAHVALAGQYHFPHFLIVFSHQLIHVSILDIEEEKNYGENRMDLQEEMVENE